MAYTFGGRKSKTAGFASNFGNLQSDGLRVAMTGILGNFMQSEDAAASPVASPISNGSGSGLTLKVPQNAAQIRINSSVTCLVGEDSSYTNGYLAPANTDTVFDCADQQYVYLKPSNGTNTIYFQFNMV
jgi:hypothetical protein